MGDACGRAREQVGLHTNYCDAMEVGGFEVGEQPQTCNLMDGSLATNQYIDDVITTADRCTLSALQDESNHVT